MNRIFLIIIIITFDIFETRGQDTLERNKNIPKNLIGAWVKSYNHPKRTLVFERNNENIIPIGEQITINNKGKLLYTYNGGCIYDQKISNGKWSYNKYSNIFKTTIPINKKAKFKIVKVTKTELILKEIK